MKCAILCAKQLGNPLQNDLSNTFHFILFSEIYYLLISLLQMLSANLEKIRKTMIHLKLQDPALNPIALRRAITQWNSESNRVK